MAVACHAGAFLREDEIAGALDGPADLLPHRRAVRTLRPEQQLSALASYADELESRLQQALAQLATVSKRCDLLAVAFRQADAERGRRGDARPLDADRLDLLARVRAEQLMSLRLLDVLARCAKLGTLLDSKGDAAALLDVRRRRELRARDLEESLEEHQALWQAEREQFKRTRDGLGATRMRTPGLWPDTA